MNIARGILIALLCGLAGLGVAEAPERLILVAHRGVVTDTVTENSLESLEGAIARGYTHVEVDIRLTKDGHAVCLHDSSLRRTTGVDKRIHEVTLRELRELVPVNVVPSFETYCDTAAGRIDLMPDIKDYPPAQREAFIAGLDATLTKYGLMDNALFIGRREIGKAFMGRARVSTSESPERLAQRDSADPAPTPHPTPNVIPAKAGISRNAGAPKPAEQNQSVPSVQSEAQTNLARNYFVFAHAIDFTRQSVRAYQALGLQVIVSINTFHYPTGDYTQQGLDDLQKMLDYGVDGLQIDAVYDASVARR